MSLSPELVKRLLNDSDFKFFKEYMLSVAESIDTVSDLGGKSNEEAGQEAKVRLLTKQKIYKILEPVLTYAEKKEPTDEEIHEVKKKFGF